MSVSVKTAPLYTYGRNKEREYRTWRTPEIEDTFLRISSAAWYFGIVACVDLRGDSMGEYAAVWYYDTGSREGVS